MFKFADLYGVEELVFTVTRLVENNHFPHASMFLGREGNEKLRLAIATARYILCSNRTQSDICGVCPDCIKTSHFSHPDMMFSFPFVKNTEVNQCEDCMLDWIQLVKTNPWLNVFEWVNQQSSSSNSRVNINVVECLRIIRVLSMQAYEGDNKVMIIWMPEYFAKEGNRMLKIIEEPPPNTFIIFVAEDTERILATILSRCQIFKVPALSADSITHILTHTYHKEQDTSKLVAHMAEGNMMEALSLFDEENRHYSEFFIDWLRKCYTLKAPDIIKWCDEFSRYNKEIQKYILNFGIHFIWEMLRSRWNSDTASVLPEPWKLAMKNLIPLLDFEKLEQLNQMLEQEIYHIERNCNMKIQLLSTSVHIHKMLRA